MSFLSNCCQCDPAQCIFQDDFNTNDLRWDDYDASGNEGGAGYSVDTGAGVLNATGTGSYTITVTPSPAFISVDAELIDNGTQTESGVTVRRADSTENISLVRVWGTADAYELRQGSTVLQSFTATGATVVRLVITDAASGTTDIEAWVGGVLQHTETGVTFVAPDAIHVGAISNSGGQWEYIKVSPCPVDGRCPTTHECQHGIAGFDPVTLPVLWQMTVPDFDPAGTGGECDPEDPVPNVCRTASSPFGTNEWVLINGSRSVSYDICDDDPNSDWIGPYRRFSTGVPCQFFSIFLDNFAARTSCDPFVPGISAGPVPVGKRPVAFEQIFCGCPSRASRTACTFGSTLPPIWSAFVTDPVNNGTTGSPVWEIKIQVQGVVTSGAAGDDAASYESSFFPIDHDFANGGPVSVNKTNELNEGADCQWPASLTLNPNGEEALRKYSSCPDDCIPLNPHAPGQLTIRWFIGTSGFFCDVLTPNFNETTFSWEFSGTVQGECSDGTLTSAEVLIRCRELEEGEVRNWYVEITESGTSTTDIFLLEVVNGDEFRGDFSGQTTGLCGGAALAGQIDACDGPSQITEMPSWLSCCPDVTINDVCCRPLFDPNQRELRAIGNIACTSGTETGDCIATEETMVLRTADLASGHSLSLVESEGYFFGELPFITFGSQDFLLIVWCQDGGQGAAILDKSDESVLSQPNITSFTCPDDTTSLQIELDNAYPQSVVCCDPFGGEDFTVTITEI